MEQPDTPISGQQQSNFLELFLAHEARFRAFARTIVADYDESQDVLQEATLTMLEKYEGRESATGFVEWGFRVISFKALELSRKKSRSRLRFNSEIVQAIAVDAQATDRSWSARSDALVRCLGGLSPEDRGLLASRYEDAQSIDEIAAKVGRPTNSVYRRISRLRNRLLDCINRRMAQIEGVS